MIFDKLINAAMEERARQKQERAAMAQRLAEFHCGYDVFPEGDGRQYASSVIAKTAVKAAVCWLCVCVFCAAVILKRDMLGSYAFMVFVGGFLMLVLFFVGLGYVRLLGRFMTGRYDIFGAVCTGKRYETDTRTDSDGNTTTTYTYYISLNGIECEVPHSQYKKAAEEQYYRFVRVIMKYINRDKYYLFPCDISERERRIGQHYPSGEPRLYKSLGMGVGFVLLAMLGFIGAVVLVFMGYNATHSDENLLYLAAGSGGFAVLMIVIGDLNRRAKERKKLERLGK